MTPRVPNDIKYYDLTLGPPSTTGNLGIELQLDAVRTRYAHLPEGARQRAEHMAKQIVGTHFLVFEYAQLKSVDEKKSFLQRLHQLRPELLAKLDINISLLSNDNAATKMIQALDRSFGSFIGNFDGVDGVASLSRKPWQHFSRQQAYEIAYRFAAEMETQRGIIPRPEQPAAPAVGWFTHVWLYVSAFVSSFSDSRSIQEIYEANLKAEKDKLAGGVQLAHWDQETEHMRAVVRETSAKLSGVQVGDGPDAYTMTPSSLRWFSGVGNQDEKTGKVKFITERPMWALPTETSLLTQIAKAAKHESPSYVQRELAALGSPQGRYEAMGQIAVGLVGVKATTLALKPVRGVMRAAASPFRQPTKLKALVKGGGVVGGLYAVFNGYGDFLKIKEQLDKDLAAGTLSSEDHGRLMGEAAAIQTDVTGLAGESMLRAFGYDPEDPLTKKYILTGERAPVGGGNNPNKVLLEAIAYLHEHQSNDPKGPSGIGNQGAYARLISQILVEHPAADRDKLQEEITRRLGLGMFEGHPAYDSVKRRTFERTIKDQSVVNFIAMSESIMAYLGIQTAADAHPMRGNPAIAAIRKQYDADVNAHEAQDATRRFNAFKSALDEEIGRLTRVPDPESIKKLSDLRTFRNLIAGRRRDFSSLDSVLAEAASRQNTHVNAFVESFNLATPVVPYQDFRTYLTTQRDLIAAYETAAEAHASAVEQRADSARVSALEQQKRAVLEKIKVRPEQFEMRYMSRPHLFGDIVDRGPAYEHLFQLSLSNGQDFAGFSTDLREEMIKLSRHLAPSAGLFTTPVSINYPFTARLDKGRFGMGRGDNVHVAGNYPYVPYASSAALERYKLRGAAEAHLLDQFSLFEQKISIAFQEGHFERRLLGRDGAVTQAGINNTISGMSLAHLQWAVLDGNNQHFTKWLKDKGIHDTYVQSLRTRIGFALKDKATDDPQAVIDHLLKAGIELSEDAVLSGPLKEYLAQYIGNETPARTAFDAYYQDQVTRYMTTHKALQHYARSPEMVQATQVAIQHMFMFPESAEGVHEGMKELVQKAIAAREAYGRITDRKPGTVITDEKMLSFLNNEFKAYFDLFKTKYMGFTRTVTAAALPVRAESEILPPAALAAAHASVIESVREQAQRVADAGVQVAPASPTFARVSNVRMAVAGMLPADSVTAGGAIPEDDSRRAPAAVAPRVEGSVVVAAV